MATPREVIDALIQQSDTRTKISLIRDWYPDIERALESGVRYDAIIKVLAEHGIHLTDSHLRQAVHTLRNKAKSARSTKSAAVPASPTTVKQPIKPTPSAPRTSVMAPAPVPLASTAPALTINPNSGWELEHQDAIIPPELLKKAFVEIAGIRVDLRQPCPAEFGEKGEEVKHQVNPSSPNWPEFKARARARITYAQDLSYWQREFKKWFVSQGYTEAQY